MYGTAIVEPLLLPHAKEKIILDKVLKDHAVKLLCKDCKIHFCKPFLDICRRLNLCYKNGSQYACYATN